MRALILMLCMLGLTAAAPAEQLFDEHGYRIKNYRRATPDATPAGTLLTTDQLKRLVDSSAPILIDVQAITVRPETREFGIAWLPDKTRWHIADSTWLPNVGYGELDPQMHSYFEDNLQRLTGGDKQKAVVFYCIVDCWMSWNAVRRAAGWGYGNIYWYPEGTDGWEQAGFRLVQGTPYPLESMQSPDDDFFTSYDLLDLRQIARQARASSRDILLVFETDHCPFCARMRRTVLKDVDVIDALQSHFIALSVNIESDQRMYDQAGHPVKISHFSQKQHRVVLTPTLLFFDPDFNLLHKHSGLIATNHHIRKLFDYVNTRAYDRLSWKQYREQ
ncbi:MAG: thioredoxin fold domain-containing protein [Gammaproteobacteria bacterium]|nr:thioredoxin fold domain-containing protein [Gammaproteobacteria bacterium]